MTMKRIARAFAGAATLWGALCTAHAQSQPPLEAFAVLPDEAPSISPDGSHFALIRGMNGRPMVAIYRVDAPSESPKIVTSADWIINGFRWVKNDVLLVYNKKNRTLGVHDTSKLMRPLEDAAAVSLTDLKMVRLSAYGRIDDVDLDDPDNIYAAFGTEFANFPCRINVRTGDRPEFFTPEPKSAEYTPRWIFDGHGKIVARVDSQRDLHSRDIPLWHNTLRVLDNGAWRPIGTFKGTVDQGDGVAGLSEDGRAVIRLAPDKKATISVTRVDITSASETKLFKDPLHDVDAALEDEWTGRIIGYSIDEDMPAYRYFDPRCEALQRGLEQAFPALSVHAVSADVADDKLIVETVGPKTPASYYLYDRGTHRATAIAASYPDLNENMLGDVKPYPYKARDGLQISAYLTLPPGLPPQNLPLVVMPHGGPDARDDMRFDWIAQFLSSRGYAVLKPNFRGSSGYGRPFTEAGLRQWGLKMQDDISDGVKKVIADGMADPKRFASWGPVLAAMQRWQEQL